MSPEKSTSGSRSAKLLMAVLNLAAPATGSSFCSSTLYTSLKCTRVMVGDGVSAETMVVVGVVVVAVRAGVHLLLLWGVTRVVLASCSTLAKRKKIIHY